MNNTKYSVKRKLGNMGESIVCKYLERNGYVIIDRNYLKKWGELDIVAEKDNLIHFMEVKTVSRDFSLPSIKNSFRPEENVHKIKINRLKRVIQTYISEKKIESKFWQFSVAILYLDRRSRKARIVFLKNIIIE
jgi:putative endonuclease